MSNAPTSRAMRAVVTGAGSGVGRSVARTLLERGWRVTLLGRREGVLRETAEGFENAQVCPCDIGDAVQVAKASKTFLADGPIDVLINAAGTNLPDRRLDQVSNEQWRDVLAANLDGAFYLAQAVLPGMRSAGRGLIVNVNSIAGLKASALSGSAYSASKFGMAALTQSINAEENERGIRATSVFPGDINTPLLEKRPNIPDTDARTRMLQPEDVAACVIFAIDMPERAVIEDLVVRPRVR